MARASARRPDRRSAAVPRGLRQAAVLAAVGSRGRREPSGCGAHRGRLGHRLSADAERKHPHLRAVRQLHGAELPVPPDEHDRRGCVRALRQPEVRLGRRRRGLPDAVHLADGHVRPAAPRADAVGPADPQRLPPRSRVFRPGQPRRPRRHRVRRRMVRLHRQGRHGDVRLQLSALAVRRYPQAAQRAVRRTAREAVLAQRGQPIRHRHRRRLGSAQ